MLRQFVARFIPMALRHYRNRGKSMRNWISNRYMATEFYLVCSLTRRSSTISRGKRTLRVWNVSDDLNRTIDDVLENLKIPVQCHGGH